MLSVTTPALAVQVFGSVTVVVPVMLVSARAAPARSATLAATPAAIRIAALLGFIRFMGLLVWLDWWYGLAARHERFTPCTAGRQEWVKEIRTRSRPQQ